MAAFLKLESFGYNNNNRDFVNQYYLRKRCRIVIITEVNFIKTFLHAVGENCHGNKKVYIVNHKGNVHGKQSLMIIISSFSFCVRCYHNSESPWDRVQLCTSTTGTS